VLRNVEVHDPRSIVDTPDVKAAVAALEQELGDRGRVLLRASGTEPLVRVMVEAEDEHRAERSATQLCAVVTAAAGVPADGGPAGVAAP
jgi:phosphoglucosamine mutase